MNPWRVPLTPPPSPPAGGMWRAETIRTYESVESPPHPDPLPASGAREKWSLRFNLNSSRASHLICGYILGVMLEPVKPAIPSHGGWQGEISTETGSAQGTFFFAPR